MHIQFSKDADLNTPLHQAAHIFLGFEAQLYEQGYRHQSQPALLNYLGVKRFDELKNPHKEQFASGFEAYLYEGMAPNDGMLHLFSTFGGWMHFVHSSIKEITNKITGQTPPVNEKLEQALASMFDPGKELTPELEAEKQKVASAIQFKMEAVEVLDSRDAQDYSQLLSQYLAVKSIQTGKPVNELYETMDLSFSMEGQAAQESETENDLSYGPGC